MTSNEPDGVYRTNIIYYTRNQEPQVFEARAAISGLRKEMQSTYRDFFRRQ